MRSYVAVTISRRQETFSLGIPFFCYAEESRYDRYKDQREETYYVCEKRNRAMTKALKNYPAATHVLMDAAGTIKDRALDLEAGEIATSL